MTQNQKPQEQNLQVRSCLLAHEIAEEVVQEKDQTRKQILDAPDCSNFAQG